MVKRSKKAAAMATTINPATAGRTAGVGSDRREGEEECGHVNGVWTDVDASWTRRAPRLKFRGHT